MKSKTTVRALRRGSITSAKAGLPPSIGQDADRGGNHHHGGGCEFRNGTFHEDSPSIRFHRNLEGLLGFGQGPVDAAVNAVVQPGTGLESVRTSYSSMYFSQVSWYTSREL